MTLAINILILLLCSLVIFKIGKRFTNSSSRLAGALGMSHSVKGATFDAFAGSMPELLVALFAVIFFGTFEVGIGTIAGSALFNLLIIPGISVLVAPVAFRVHKQVFSRDAFMYIIAAFVLVVLVEYFAFWGVGIAIFLLAMYWYYVSVIVKQTRSGKLKSEAIEVPKKVNIKREALIVSGSILLIAGATYLLTRSTIIIAEVLNIPAVIAAFALTAAATSVPDTVISVTNARKGNIDDAASNVFGSNIFDIFVALGFPLLIFTIFHGPVLIEFDYVEILFGLLGATIMVLYFFAEDHVLSKKQGIALLGLYVVFLAYVVLVSLGLVGVSVV